MDAFHANLVNPQTGESLLTAENLLRAVNADTECLFVNRLGSTPEAVARCIRAAKKSLRCFSMQASVLTIDILKALSECENLGSVLQLRGAIAQARQQQSARDTNGGHQDQTPLQMRYVRRWRRSTKGGVPHQAHLPQ